MLQCAVKRGRLVILLVEDGVNDIYFVRPATQAGGAGHRVCGVNNGEEAIAYLKGEGRFADREKYPLPNVVLTDLKMPGMGGFEILHWLRSNPRYAVIPTLVYSNSHLESDVQEAYRLGANSYIAKPTSIKDMVDILHLLYQYWSRCETPRVPANSEPAVSATRG